jgi:hypothetical protein
MMLCPSVGPIAFGDYQIPGQLMRFVSLWLPERVRQITSLGLNLPYSGLSSGMFAGVAKNEYSLKKTILTVL